MDVASVLRLWLAVIGRCCRYPFRVMSVEETAIARIMGHEAIRVILFIFLCHHVFVDRVTR